MISERRIQQILVNKSFYKEPLLLDDDEDDEKLYLKHGKNIGMTIENKGEIYLK